MHSPRIAADLRNCYTLGVILPAPMADGTPKIPGNGMEQRPQAEQLHSPEFAAAHESEPVRETPAFDVASQLQAEAEPPQAAAPAPAAPAPSPAAVEHKDELRMKVERVLEENLWELYLGLPPAARQKFREAGEKVATEMRALIDAEKIKPAEVHAKVDHWLKTIPRVNPWFLLQEGKIKTDNVLALARERHGSIE